MLKCGIAFDNLISLDLRSVSIGTVLRLNGPGSLGGAENLKDLTLTVSIQFADKPLVEKAEIEFSELLDALACHALRNLKLLFINDGYHIGDDLTTELNASYFLEQLRSTQNTLETLSITLETTDDDGELDWLIDMCQHPTKSLKDFTALISLVIPQAFLFNAQTAGWNTEDNCQPKNFPPNLEELELLFPHEAVEEWAEGFLDEEYYKDLDDSVVLSSSAQGRGSKFKKLILTCREDVGLGARYFTEQVDQIWWSLSADCGIEAEVYDQSRDTRLNLAVLYEDEHSDEEESDVEDHGVKVGENDSGDDGQIIQYGHSGGHLEAVRADLQSLMDQTAILRYLRNIPQSEGFPAAELGGVLHLSWEKVSNATTRLISNGNVGVTGVFPQTLRYHFVTESEELQRQDRLKGLFDEEADDGGWETDDSMPELETYDPETLAVDIPSHTPCDVVVTPTSVLRCLRDMSNPANGLLHWEINTLLGTHNSSEVASAVRQLVRDGHASNSHYDERVYFISENPELRAEDMD